MEKQDFDNSVRSALCFREQSHKQYLWRIWKKGDDNPAQ